MSPHAPLNFMKFYLKRVLRPNLAYELADLKIQTGDITTAALNITYGIANASHGYDEAIL